MARSFQKKNFKKGKGSWKSRSSKTVEVKVPSVLFNWRQPAPSDARRWMELWPEKEEYDTYFDPFLGSGLGWTHAGQYTDRLFVNDRNNEYISAMRLVSKGEPNVIDYFRKWLRIWGVLDAWPENNLTKCLAFHVEHYGSHVKEDVTTLRRKMSNLVLLTCNTLFNIQEKEFNFQIPFFKQVIEASLVGVMKRSLELAKLNGEPLPPETLVNELGKAMRSAGFIYIKQLYINSCKVDAYSNPYHVMLYVVLNSIGRRDELGQWRLAAPVSFADYEKTFRPFESPLVHALGYRTKFIHNEAASFLLNNVGGSSSFTFAKVPSSYPAVSTGGLYDILWKRPGLFLMICEAEKAKDISHKESRKSFNDSKGRDMVALANYVLPGEDETDLEVYKPSEIADDSGSIDEPPDFSL